MVLVVGVRFKKAGKVYYFDPAEYPIAVGSKVVVETARGVEYGDVAIGPKQVSDDQVVQPLKKVIRPGSERDAAVAVENKRKEREAFSAAQKKIEAHNLDMNLVDVEFTFDSSKIIFYFTAEGRIDFRELVRDLAGVFRTRIEMRQIGVRDEAKLLGGIGPCGRILCCTSFLGDFAPVSIRMAKDQNLSLNPSKISGLCGRLMCCLRYEQDTYEAAKKDPTLAPSYVPPPIPSDSDPNLDDLEDRLTPPIGVLRRGERSDGLSARVAQAAGLAELPKARQDGPRPQGVRPILAPPEARRQGDERIVQPQQQGRPNVAAPEQKLDVKPPEEVVAQVGPSAEQPREFRRSRRSRNRHRGGQQGGGKQDS